MGGTFVLSETLAQFLLAAAVGVLIGIAVGAVSRWGLCLTSETYADIGVTLLAPYVAWVIAEMVHASGVLACVAGGIYLRRHFSAIGSGSGFTFAADSGNNLPLGANLMLEPLAANGGPTLTHAMQAASPLINAGSNASTPADLTTDQRGTGFPRIVGAAVDIGAFERDAGPPVAASAQFVYFTAPQSLRFTFSENVGQSLGVSDLVLKNLTTGATIPGAALALSYDTTGDVATFMRAAGVDRAHVAACLPRSDGYAAGSGLILRQVPADSRLL